MKSVLGKSELEMAGRLMENTAMAVAGAVTGVLDMCLLATWGSIKVCVQYTEELMIGVRGALMTVLPAVIAVGFFPHSEPYGVLLKAARSLNILTEIFGNSSDFLLVSIVLPIAMIAVSSAISVVHRKLGDLIFFIEAKLML